MALEDAAPARTDDSQGTEPIVEDVSGEEPKKPIVETISIDGYKIVASNVESFHQPPVIMEAA